MNLRSRAMVLAILVGQPLSAQQGESSVGQRLSSAISQGSFGAAVRYRFELVDDAASQRNAFASTLRTILHYETASFYGFTGYIEAENIADLGVSKKHNNTGSGDTNNGITNRPVIADPPLTTMNQAYVQWHSRYVTARVGRQEINYGNQRFIGAVGWRQHHQTFVAAQTRFAWSGLTVDYAFLDQIKRITGASLETSSHLINVSYTIAGMGVLSGYAYLLDLSDPANAPLSTNTFGGVLSGNPALRDAWILPFRAEYAEQRDAANHPANIKADYFHFMIGIDNQGRGLRAGWERMSGDPTDGHFATPLATGHAFNGWADKFLTTPTNGLHDLYLRVDGNIDMTNNTVALIAAYHEFKSTTGSGTYGREVDVDATYQFSSRELVGFRAARYIADNFSTNATKIWLYVQWSL